MLLKTNDLRDNFRFYNQIPQKHESFITSKLPFKFLKPKNSTANSIDLSLAYKNIYNFCSVDALSATLNI